LELWSTRENVKWKTNINVELPKEMLVGIEKLLGLKMLMGIERLLGLKLQDDEDYDDYNISYHISKIDRLWGQMPQTIKNFVTCLMYLRLNKSEGKTEDPELQPYQSTIGIKVKGKGRIFPVLSTEHQAMKAYWGVEV
jgi:hypothetical protein